MHIYEYIIRLILISLEGLYIAALTTMSSRI